MIAPPEGYADFADAAQLLFLKGYDVGIDISSKRLYIVAFGGQAVRDFTGRYPTGDQVRSAAAELEPARAAFEAWG